MPRTYSAAEVDAAVARLLEPGRFDHASQVVTHAAPSLAGILDQALGAAWFDAAHEEQVVVAATAPDEERLEAVRELMAEQARLGMLVGVAVGFELAHQLETADDDQPTEGS